MSPSFHHHGIVFFMGMITNHWIWGCHISGETITNPYCHMAYDRYISVYCAALIFFSILFYQNGRLKSNVRISLPWKTNLFPNPTMAMDIEGNANEAFHYQMVSSEETSSQYPIPMMILTLDMGLG